MNEKERRMALESVNQGLDALKKAYGLSDDQFDALMNFVDAEAILNKEPQGSCRRNCRARDACGTCPSAAEG